MRILVQGAGVIGQVYAGRLHRAGHAVTVLARGRTHEALVRAGITLVHDGRTTTCGWTWSTVSDRATRAAATTSSW